MKDARTSSSVLAQMPGQSKDIHRELIVGEFLFQGLLDVQETSLRILEVGRWNREVQFRESNDPISEKAFLCFRSMWTFNRPTRRRWPAVAGRPP